MLLANDTELEVLRDRGLYRPTHADDLPWGAHAALVGELRQVVQEVPGKDFVPVPGPLEANNRLYWGREAAGTSSVRTPRDGRARSSW